MKFFIEDFFSKCEKIRRKLRIWSNLLFVQCKLWFQKNCKLNSKQELSYSKNQLHMSERAKHFTQNQAIFQSSRSAGYCIENNMRNTN